MDKNLLVFVQKMNMFRSRKCMTTPEPEQNFVKMLAETD